MTEIRFKCVCGKKLKAREEWAGKQFLCPACKKRLVIPSRRPKEPQSKQRRPKAKTPPSAKPANPPAGGLPPTPEAGI